MEEQEYQPIHTELYNEFKRLQDENFHLKKQLKNKNKDIKGKVATIRTMKKEMAHLKPNKQHYKNGKRGTFKNG